MVPAKMTRAFEGIKVYQTGTVKIVQKGDQTASKDLFDRFYMLSLRNQSLLLNVFGIPDEPKVQLPNSNAHILLVPAKEERNDMLFIGGNPMRMEPFSIRGPFTAYERVTGERD